MEGLLAEWRAAELLGFSTFDEDCAAHSRFWQLAGQIVASLPPHTSRTPPEVETVGAIVRATRAARERFLRQHVEAIYAALTGGFSQFVRVEDLVLRAAEAFPGLVPDRTQLAA